MTDLIYPNLFLFLYDLREGLGESQQDLEKNRKIFASKLPEHLRDSLFQLDDIIETEYLELLTKKIEHFSHDIPDEGYYFPVRLNDTYGILLAASFPNNKTRHPASSIAQLKKKIEAKLKDSYGSNLGQTWLIFAELANNKNPEKIAKQCCKTLNIDCDWEKDLQGRGQLLGGTIFELRRYGIVMSKDFSSSKNPPTIGDIQENHHLIISLYPNEQSADKAENFDIDWLRLFSYRHKILWAYAQSRYLKQLLKKDAVQIKEYIDGIQSYKNPGLHLKQLQKILVKAPSTLYRYSIILGYLENQTRTIEINLLNYQRRLEKIREKATSKAVENLLPKNIPSPISQLSQLTINGEDIASILARIVPMPGIATDLKFMEKFSQEISEKYLLQVQKDYANLSPNLKLLEDLINSIRGITEIDQAKRDRIFQNNIAIVGVGAGAASVAASASASYIVALEEIPIVARYIAFWQLNREQTNLVLAVNFSIVAGVLVAIGTALAIKLGESIRGRSRH